MSLALLNGASAEAAGTQAYVRAGPREQLSPEQGRRAGDPNIGGLAGLNAQSLSVAYSDPAYDGHLGAPIGVSAAATAYAKLATGKLGVTTTDGSYYSESRANAVFEDLLNFTIVGASAATVTPITIIWRTHGDLAFVPGYGGGALQSNVYIDNGAAALSFSLNTDPNGSAITPVHAAWTAQNMRSGSYTTVGDLYTVSGTYDLFGSNPTLLLRATLTLSTFGTIQGNFGNTAGITLILPQNASFTSASGVFLTAGSGVPEPTIWLALITGFGLTGGVIRYRRRKSAVGSVG